MLKPVIRFSIPMLMLLLSMPALADENPTALQRVMERGALSVAVYRDYPPFSFSDKGRVVGIDADIARALADRLGVAALIRAVGADESMEDDLRNNVWKGHYLGGGTADFMLHVPYDDAFAEENDRVILLAPYYREQLVIATRATVSESPFDLFTREKVGVELDTLADFHLLSTNGGTMRNQVVHFRSMGEAVEAFKSGELAGVAGPRVEIEYALGAQREDYRVVNMPGLRRGGWDLGGAVKQGNDDLASAIRDGMQALRESGAISEIFQRYHATYQPPLRLSGVTIAPASELALNADDPELCKRRP
ncbi:MAG: transporter substrate-binding domain-containing protein [Gammaproteobacteria bacterium]|nr:transporter substrate-binding domain-containing protein [Gammaproteobacteria bacterium]